MDVEYDTEKDQANRRKHGISLALAAAMDFDVTLVIADERRDYGEAWFRALAPSTAGCMCWFHHARRDFAGGVPAQGRPEGTETI